jgi:hypothetical protein
MDCNKIETKSIENNEKHYYNLNMKPTYSTNNELHCGIINYFNKTYLVDFDDKDKIINFNKTFVLTKEDDIYPSYAYNYKRFNFLDFIFNFSNNSVCYNFKNNNCYDLRKNNVEIYHSFHSQIIKKYNVIEYIKGHYLTLGQGANIMKNPMWKIKDDDETEYLLMYCEKNTICRLCCESYQKILNYELCSNNHKKITWFYHQNGYIMGSNNMYIHQVITGCYGNGKGTKIISVDHIDQNPLNNTYYNLRIATRKEQEQNTKGIKEGTKRERKQNAKKLPEGITHDMLQKHVVYYQEWLDKKHTKQREYFKVESHPKLDKPWLSSKSNKVLIRDKLEQANSVVNDLEKNIYPKKCEQLLPKYISLVISREKPHLVFEKRLVDGKRLNIKMILPKEYNLQEQLEKINIKIKEKYEEENIL